MLNDLLDLLIRSGDYQRLRGLLDSNQLVPALGLPRSVRWYLLAGLYHDQPRSLLLVTDRTDRCLKIIDELHTWLPEAAVHYFPEPTPSFYEQASWGATVRRDRLQTLTHLAGYHTHPCAIKPRVLLSRRYGL